MKISYDALAATSMAWLEESTANANEIQETLLSSLLEKNKDTVYGRKYGFETIASALEYQQKVPMTTYGDYDLYIQQMLGGEKHVLMAEEPVFYCISSGSTGGPKYLPLSEADLWVHYYGIYGTVFGAVRQHYPKMKEEALFGKILQTGEFVKTYTEKGVMKGIRSGALYQWLDQEGQFSAADYTVPKEVLFPEELVDLTYVKARFALAEPNVGAIHSVFIHHIIGLMQYIETHWDLLRNDMALGQVDASIPLGQAWREKVVGWLPPDPKRAEALGTLSKETLADGMILKIWKNMKYCMAIGGHTMERYGKQYEQYAKGVPTQHFVYGSSEGMMGAANGMNRPDSYILLPRAGFFEFIPQEDTGEIKRPLFCHEVKVGETYELVYTNLSGLYRYQMKDVLRIEGFYGQSPMVSFSYRKNQVLNISDEKMNMAQLELAISSLEERTGLGISGYCVVEDHSHSPGSYLCYLECTTFTDDGCEAVFDACLCEASYGYAGCRHFGQIGQAKIAYVKEGAFQRYKEMLGKKGYEMGQNKPTRMISDEDSRRFFRRETRSQKEEAEHGREE